MEKVSFSLVDCTKDGAVQHLTADRDSPFREVLSRLLPGTNLGALTIRVNRRDVPEGYTLQEGDRVTLSPSKVSGAQ